jgi:hypothetical protein
VHTHTKFAYIIAFWFLTVCFAASLSSYLTLHYVGQQMDSGPFWTREGELWSTRLTFALNVAAVSSVASVILMLLLAYLFYSLGE